MKTKEEEIIDKIKIMIENYPDIPDFIKWELIKKIQMIINNTGGYTNGTSN